MRVLAVGAHPDDVEIFCSGTLIKCVERGDTVIICYACSGDLGHMVIPPEELKVIRANEAKKAGALEGMEVIWGGFDDMNLFENNREARDKMVDVIRYANPDLIITQNPVDYHADHSSISKLVFDASFTATLPNYKCSVHRLTKDDTPAKLVPIYYMDTDAGMGFGQPDIYVDVSSLMDRKLKMLACHESQVVWLKEHDGIDLAEICKSFLKNRGYQCGVEYAEAFRQCRVYLKGTTKRLLPE